MHSDNSSSSKQQHDGVRGIQRRLSFTLGRKAGWRAAHCLASTMRGGVWGSDRPAPPPHPSPCLPPRCPETASGDTVWEEPPSRGQPCAPLYTHHRSSTTCQRGLRALLWRRSPLEDWPAACVTLERRDLNAPQRQSHRGGGKRGGGGREQGGPTRDTRSNKERGASRHAGVGRAPSVPRGPAAWHTPRPPHPAPPDPSPPRSAHPHGHAIPEVERCRRRKLQERKWCWLEGAVAATTWSDSPPLPRPQ